MSKISRRGMLGGLLGGAVVLGFNPLARSWVTEASAAAPFVGLPPLDGTLATDPASLAEMANDFGHIVHRTPIAVLRAASVNDVVKMVNYARVHGIKIVGRGNGHTTFGQSQTDVGVVIDVRGLNQIYSISKKGADVGAGVVWRDLLAATTQQGLTPPVLTDYLKLTVGGTLSMGGIGGMSWRHGVQLDNVEELTVVTGTGQIVVCSPKKRRDLFDAALGGMGLVGIIVRATISLIEAEEQARTYNFAYADIPTMLKDMRTLIDQKRFDYVRGQAVPDGNGWLFAIEATTYFTPHCGGHDGSSQQKLLKNLRYIPGTVTVTDRTYYDYCDSVTQLFEYYETLGLNALPHAWLDLFVPDSAIDDFASQSLAEADMSMFMPGSLVLFFGFEAKRINQPMFRVPDEDRFFLFDIIRSVPPDPGSVAWALQNNRAMYDENRCYGGTAYAISTVALTRADWQAHFGDYWPELCAAKAKYDPAGILGAGVNVFN